MPRIPFTDLASSPEFKALPPEDQQTVASGYWDDIAVEQPDRAEFFNGMREASKALFDTKSKRNDAPSVQRRFLDTQVQDLAFDLSLGDELAQGRLTQDGYAEALKVRDTERAQRQSQLDKTRDLISDDPKKQQALALRLDGLEQTAITGGVFGSAPLMQRVFGTADASKDAYAALREQTAKDYGLEPDEVDALVKPRLGMLDKPVSLDPIGNPFIQPEVLAQGPDAVKDAILKSELPWREKQRLTEKDDLAERMDGYYKATVEGVQKNHPELYAILDLDQVQDDPKTAFSLIQASLNKSGFEKFAGGFTADTLSTAEQIAPMVAVDPVLNRQRGRLTVEGSESPDLVAERRKEVQDTVAVSRRAQESVNQLSQEFYKNQGTLWGVDMSAYGSGAGSVLTAVGAGLLTGGASIPVSSARVATMGPTALRMLNGANSVMKASPSIGLAMAKTGTSTYEQAIKSGMSEEEAGEQATLAAATEGVITGTLSLFGAGGLESVGEQLVGTAARQAVRDSAKNVVRNFREKVGKGVLGEQFEENLIAAFDAATVQARINPSMTVEDFQNTLRETALVTLAVSGPTIGAGSLREALDEKATYQQSLDEIELRANLNLADAALRDRLRREGGVGTPLGERLRRPATQPGAANLPPTGQATPDAPQDGGAPAPGAPAPVAPGGTQPVAPAQGPTGAPAEVPGVQPAGAAEPVLVPADAVNETPVGERQTELPPTGETQVSDSPTGATATASEPAVGVSPTPTTNEEQNQSGTGNLAGPVSEGQAVAESLTTTESPGDTKPHAALLDEQGVPKRLFHGKAAPFKNSEFLIKPNQLTNLSGLGPAWFSTSRNQAERFVGETPEGPGEVVEPTRIDIRNPLVLRGSPESVSAARENRKIRDIVGKSQMTETLSDDDFEILKDYLLGLGITTVKGKKTADLTPWAHKFLVTDEAAKASRNEYAEMFREGTHPDSDPFGQLKRLLKEAEVTLSASGVNTEGLTEGEMLRRALELEGKDGIVLIGTMADTKVEDEPSDWVVPFSSEQLVFESPTPTTNETAPVQTPPAAETAQDTTGRGPGVPTPVGEAGPATAQDTPVVEAQEPPAETFREQEPNMTEVFEELRKRDPETQPVNTESPRFKALVTELKEKRAAEMAGGMAQRVADIAAEKKRVVAEQEKRRKAINKKKAEREAAKPLDVHQKRIKELTKGGKYPNGIGHGNSGAIKDWLVARGMNPKFTNNKDWREVALMERDANSTAKTERIRENFNAMTDEAKEVVEAFHKMRKKGAEEKPTVENFMQTRVGRAIDALGGVRSKKWYQTRKRPVPSEYDDAKNRIPPQLGTRIYNDSDTASGIDDVATEAGMSVPEVWSAIQNFREGRIDGTMDQDDYVEAKRVEAENREIAFAEQQLEASGNESNQTVDLREVRDGDRFTIGGVEYTATDVVADERGRTESFMLFNFDPEAMISGPLSGTKVTEDFFAEGVVPTAGSISHIDPAEIEAISIAQEFPEEFEAEAAAEPAPAPAAEPAPTPPAEPAPTPAATVTPPPAEPAPTPAAEPAPTPAEPAAPAPAAEIPEGAVGTANVMTDQMRSRRGMPPRADQARLGNEQAWDAAMEILDGDPNAGAVLVDRLTKSPRSIDPVETSLFTHELLVRENALDKALDIYNRSPNAKNLEAVQIAETAVRDAILTAERIGTIEGRALQARKILVHQDFSFGRLAAMKVKAQGGKALSVDQTKELVELHEQMKEIRQQLEIANAKIAEQEAQQLTLNIQVEFKKELKDAKKRGEKPMTFLERKAEESRKWLAAQRRSGQVNTTFLPAQEVYHLSVIGVSYIAKGFNTIGAFTERLVKDFGRKYSPFARDIFAKSQELYETAAPSSRVKPKEDILSAIEPDAPLDGKAIYQLVRHYINEDVEGATFDGVMDAVLADLKEVYPDLDRRQLHVAYSNYGKVTQPDPAEDAKKARDYRALARLQSQLEDAQRGLAPLKTGMQRDPAIQAVRDLEKEVRDTMKRLGIQPTNENNQRKNTLDAIKTRLRNEFEDLDKAVKTGVPRPAYQSQTEYDEEARRLKQRRDDRKKDYDAIFKAPGLTQEQQLERAEKLLDRRIAEERKLLAEGLLQRARDVKMGPMTPELVRLKAQLDQLKADRRERQKAAKPKKPELLKKYERDLASLEKRIKEEEALLAAGLTARQRDIRMGRWTPQMAELQARLDALRDQRRALAESLRPTKDEAVAAYEKATRAIEASIERYKEIIAGIAKPAPGKKYTPDAEMLALIDQRDALRDAVAVLRESDPARIDKRKQAAVKALEKSVIEITRKIQDGDLSTRSKSDPFASDPDIVKLRASRDLLNKVMADLRQMKMPKRTPEEIAINRDQAMLQRKILNLEKRIRTKDYSKPVKSSPPSYATRDALVKRKKDLESKFNDDLLQAELAQRSLGRKIFDNTTDVVFGVSRAMLTSFDAGAFGRQAGLVNYMRPGLALRNLPANFAFSEKAASRYEAALESDPNYARALASKLAITTWRPGSSLSDREEVYRSRLAKKIPGVGASERAYVTYLNAVRFSYFNTLVDTLSATEQTEANLQRIASHVNTMSGRGNLGKMEASAAAFAAVFFSPKYWWSRLQILGGLVYHPLDAISGFRLGKDETRAARKIIAQEYGRLIAAVGVVYSLAALAKFGFGAEDDEFEVVTDPRSSDFGKLKFNNTRIDPMAGLLQNVVFISRMLSGSKVTVGGDEKALTGPDAAFKETRLGETIRLLRTKLSPAAGSIVNFMDEQDVVGNKFTLETEILGSYIPMSIAETYSSMRELGLAPGVAAGLLGFVGYSANTYGGEEKGTVIEQDIFTGKILEPFGITPGEFFIDQSRYEEEKREPVYKLPKPKPLPGL